MSIWLKVLLTALAGYLLGAVQWGIIVTRHFGVQDIRKYGSGGTGATNVLRTIGLRPSLITFICDLAKGLFAGLIGRWLLGTHGACVGGLFAVIGHAWPVFYQFKGGKGVSTSLGALISVEPILGLATMAIGFTLAFWIRIISVASLTSTLFSMAVLMILRCGDWVYVVFATAICGLIFFLHRDNIKRLLRGEEKKISFSKRV